MTFPSTNHMANAMVNTRGMIGKVTRWDPMTDQLIRWMGVALLRAQVGFRRVRGHRQLGELASAEEHSELAAMTGFSYQCPSDGPLRF